MQQMQICHYNLLTSISSSRYWSQARRRLSISIKELTGPRPPEVPRLGPQLASRGSRGVTTRGQSLTNIHSNVSHLTDCKEYHQIHSTPHKTKLKPIFGTKKLSTWHFVNFIQSENYLKQHNCIVRFINHSKLHITCLLYGPIMIALANFELFVTFLRLEFLTI